jgi:hypothetical protein
MFKNPFFGPLLGHFPNSPLFFLDPAIFEYPNPLISFPTLGLSIHPHPQTPLISRPMKTSKPKACVDFGKKQPRQFAPCQPFNSRFIPFWGPHCNLLRILAGSGPPEGQNTLIVQQILTGVYESTGGQSVNSTH